MKLYAGRLRDQDPWGAEDFAKMIDAMEDDDAWDTIVRWMLQFGAALLLSALVFLDLIVMDVPWLKATLVAWIVIGCAAFKLGVWSLRKFALALTLYAIGYLIGALPHTNTVGAYFTRILS